MLAFSLLCCICLSPFVSGDLNESKRCSRKVANEAAGERFGFVLRRAAAPLHTVPLFLPPMHRSRAHLVSDGLAPPLARFPSALSTPLPSVHGTCVQSNAAYWGGVKKSRGSGQPFSMFFFPTAEMESGRDKGPKPHIVTSNAGQACVAPASHCRLYPNQEK